MILQEGLGKDMHNEIDILRSGGGWQELKQQVCDATIHGLAGWAVMHADLLVNGSIKGMWNYNVGRTKGERIIIEELNGGEDQFYRWEDLNYGD